MLLVQTYVDFSPNKGIGLFAKENILEGTKYWIRNEIFDNVISPQQLVLLEEIAVSYIKEHGFLEITGNWYLCCDNARFSNHSENPNSKDYFDSKGLVEFTLASKDILTGEEILCNYKEICLECKNNLNFKVFKQKF